MAAAVLIAAAALLIINLSDKMTLCLSNSDTGEVYLELPVEDMDRFSVTYIHSVHQTPVIETYEIRGTEIYVVEAKFYTFGAGMQTDYPEGVTYHYDDDGGIVCTGYNIYCKDLIYCVGKVSDHVLDCGGTEYSLRDICGRGSLVAFTIED